MGTVTKLIVYPIKSCQGISVQEAQCTKYGLQISPQVYDRHFMVVKPNGRFVSQRTQPKMALVEVKVTDCGLELNAPGMTPVTLSWTNCQNGSKKNCSVWGASLEGLDCGETASDWISKYLGVEGLRLMQYSTNLRKRNFSSEAKPWETKAVDDDWSGYADWGPYLMLPSASVDELNKHLPRKIDDRSFRPNIVVDGSAALDEDNWEEVRFGDKVQMRCLDACTRCVLTTVDPNTGVKNEDGEPLKTLKRIRSIHPYNEPCFGINLAPDSLGLVKVGDPVYAIRSSN